MVKMASISEDGGDCVASRGGMMVLGLHPAERLGLIPAIYHGRGIKRVQFIRTLW